MKCPHCGASNGFNPHVELGAKIHLCLMCSRDFLYTPKGLVKPTLDALVDCILSEPEG